MDRSLGQCFWGTSNTPRALPRLARAGWRPWAPGFEAVDDVDEGLTRLAPRVGPEDFGKWRRRSWAAGPDAVAQHVSDEVHPTALPAAAQHPRDRPLEPLGGVRDAKPDSAHMHASVAGDGGSSPAIPPTTLGLIALNGSSSRRAPTAAAPGTLSADVKNVGEPCAGARVVV